MINKIGVQLYTVRDFMKTPEDVRSTFKRLKEMGYDQAQTAGSAIPYEEFAQIAKEEKLEIVGTHESFQRMVDDFDEALRIQKVLDCNIMGVGGSGRNIRDIEEVKKAIADMNTICAKLKPLGMKFSYHHHSAEFIKHDNGKTVMDMFVEGLDKEVGTFCVDTYWLQNGGADVRYWIEKLSNRIEVLHLKDMRKDINEPDWQKCFYCEIGEGNLYWDGIMESASKANVKYYVVEQDFSEDPFKSLEISSKFLHKNYVK